MAASSSSKDPRSVNVRRSTAKQRRRPDVLEVNVRTKHALRLRKEKFYGFSSKLILVVAALVALGFGGRKLVTALLLKNPDYNVAQLNVETDGVLSPEVVLESADIQKGSNIFFVNLDRARARIEAIPQVEKAQVSKQLPNRITIHINERKPVAWVAANHSRAGRDEVVTAAGSHLIDAHGILLPAKNAQPQDHFLPIIRNYGGAARSDGQEAEGEEVKAALDLLHAQQDSVIAARFQIQEIDLAKQFGLQVTDRNGLQVLFGLDDMERQLKRLDVDLQVLDQSPAKPQTINLLVQKNVPVTFVTEPVASAPAPTPAPSVAATPATPSGKNAASGTKSKSTAVAKETKKSHSAQKAPERTSHGAKPKRGPQPFGKAL